MNEFDADSLSLCRERLPGLFDAALVRLRGRAARGSRDAVAALDDRMGGRVACRLQISGAPGGDVFLVAEGGRFRIDAGPPAGVPVGYALRMPADVVRRGFAWLDAGSIDAARLGDVLLRLASREAANLFTRYPCAFAARVAGVPEIGELAFALALGPGTFDAPHFTLSVPYAVLEEARGRGESPRDVLLSGKARIEGDSARAMMLALTFAQLR